MDDLEELLNIQWNNDQRMVKHCLMRCLYVQSGDTFINCGDRKPSIDREMWYDDETDGPQVNFENFKAYNMRSNAPTPLSERYRDFGQIPIPYVCTELLQRQNRRQVAVLLIRHIDEPVKADERRATESELAVADNALRSARDDCERRLYAYWKRYSDKVYARGYWANR